MYRKQTSQQTPTASLTYQKRREPLYRHGYFFSSLFLKPFKVSLELPSQQNPYCQQKLLLSYTSPLSFHECGWIRAFTDKKTQLHRPWFIHERSGIATYCTSNTQQRDTFPSGTLAWGTGSFQEHTVQLCRTPHKEPLQRSYLFRDEGAWESDSWPKEDPTAENDLSVETVTEVTKDRCRNHETTDENCKGEKKERNV